MPNPEHVEMLKQGADAWNRWRLHNRGVAPNFIAANLHGADLQGAHLHDADLTRANFDSAIFKDAQLFYSNLDQTSFTAADLSSANLAFARLWYTNLSNARLQHTNLAGAVLNGAHLEGTDFAGADVSLAIFTNVDLSTAIGLETTRHIAPSRIDIDTIYKSKGKIPEDFLRGCGVPEDFITYARSLVINPIEYYSCFISYSSQDKEFADRLHADLQAKAIRCWYAPEDLKIGDKFRTRIEESIRVYDKVMIVLSENSIQSAWVEDEVVAGLERERQNPSSLVLFPISLDNAIMETKQAWAASLRRTRHIGDFSDWKNRDSYQKSFERLLRDLKSQTKAAPAK